MSEHTWKSAFVVAGVVLMDNMRKTIMDRGKQAPFLREFKIQRYKTNIQGREVTWKQKLRPCLLQAGVIRNRWADPQQGQDKTYASLSQWPRYKPCGEAIAVASPCNRPECRERVSLIIISSRQQVLQQMLPGRKIGSIWEHDPGGNFHHGTTLRRWSA